MRRLCILLTVLLVALPAMGEEEAGTTCGLHALVDADDAGLLAAYDGLRKGLELGHLPRVCRHDPDPTTGGIAGFLERQAMAAAPRREGGKPIDPIFVIGDAACAAVQAVGTRLPTVMAVTRYTAKRKPLVPLPQAATGAVVYCDIAMEQVEALLDRMHGRLPSMRSTSMPLAVRWLRRDPANPPDDFATALARSRKEKLPLVSDNRAHFGLGAVVVIVPRHDLLGKAAADEGRKLRTEPDAKPTTRAVPGFEVWVDLAAADAIGFELPLAFLARADKLKRGKPKAAR
ncbi:MAG: hypothetical protein P1V36_04675 [Planctomycetota bacterium]|nr:hypothetical protein [Planctomycetota bacterium]